MDYFSIFSSIHFYSLIDHPIIMTSFHETQTTFLFFFLFIGIHWWDHPIIKTSFHETHCWSYRGFTVSSGVLYETPHFTLLNDQSQFYTCRKNKVIPLLICKKTSPFSIFMKWQLNCSHDFNLNPPPPPLHVPNSSHCAIPHSCRICLTEDE